MKRILFLSTFIILCSALIPVGVFAATTKLQYAVWLPFWQSQNGAQDISLHLDSLNEVSPFSYELDANGDILDDLHINNGSWAGWFSAIKELGIKNIPTIAYFSPTGIYNLLSYSKSRQAEETSITKLVTTQGFDGIDIDFESMTPATRPYYSLFIQGLATRLHAAGKMLTCTVVPRTPTDSLYLPGQAPTTITYPENYSVLNTYCDEVRLMAYDQEQVDLKLDASKGSAGQFYGPVADPDWVKKVVTLATTYINPKKIMLGIPTYGYEYEVSWSAGATTYTRVRSFTYLQAMDRLDNLNVTSTRDPQTNELTFMYTSSTYLYEPPILTSYISSTEPLALAALNGGNQGGAGPTTLFYVSFPDASSTAGEIALAKSLGLRGVVLFKADGMQDPLTWQVMK